MFPFNPRLSFRARSSLIRAVTYLNGLILDGSVIRIEVDKGFREGRQFGRAATGGQVRPLSRLIATFQDAVNMTAQTLYSFDFPILALCWEARRPVC